MRQLDRFLKAQNNYFYKALAEISNEKKETHWMWFIFPQIKGLGSSEASRYYAIEDKKEAMAYLKHPVLGPRLSILCYALLKQGTDNPVNTFGPIDSHKLQSSMTLFYTVSGITLYKSVLDKFYNGKLCKSTLDILEAQAHEDQKVSVKKLKEALAELGDVDMQEKYFKGWNNAISAAIQTVDALVEIEREQ